MNRSPNPDLLALSHPLALLSVFVLLINDHVLKVYVPSALTGKISDFAGLFFFPLLLGAILNLTANPLQIKPHRMAIGSFGFTAVWFSLIKTLPFFSALTGKFLSSLLFVPVQIVTDPGDLLALVMLIPAWKLRSRVEQGNKKGNKRLSYLALGLASIAVMATSPMVIFTVKNLIVADDLLFTPAENSSGDYYYSADGGRTWEWFKFDAPASVAAQSGEYPELPVTVCLPDNPEVCYQTGAEAILESNDGGQTWHESWNIPAGRRQFLERSSPYLDIGPYDLIAFDHKGKQEIIAALGTGGVLVKTGAGPWENFEAAGAGPLHFESKDFGDAVGMMFGEIFTLSVIALVLLFILVVGNVTDRDSKFYSLLKKSCIALILLFIPAYSLLYTGQSLFFVFLFLFLFTAAATVILLLFQIGFNTTRKGQVGILILLFDWLASGFAFALWANGTIPMYGVSFIMAVVFNILTVIWIFRRQFADAPPAP